MNSAIERLLELRVTDVMNSHVLTIRDSEDMQDAARRLFDAEVTGAPVVDATGKCVGVLSNSDFVGRDSGRHDLQLLTRTGPNEPYTIECLNDNLVGTHMAPLVQTVAAEATIVAAARIMTCEGIHRLVVVDTEDRPIGIISTLDVAASLVNAVSE